MTKYTVKDAVGVTNPQKINSAVPLSFTELSAPFNSFVVVLWPTASLFGFTVIALVNIISRQLF